MLEIIITISLLCCGIHVTTRENGIFSFWQSFIRNYETLNYKTELFHPVSECLVCMSSFWTCLYLGLLSPMSSIDILMYLIVFCVLVSSFVVGSKIIDKIAVFLYLIGVFIFLLHVGYEIYGFIVLFSVAGLNALFAAIARN